MKHRWIIWILKGLLTLVVAVACLALVVPPLLTVGLGGSGERVERGTPSDGMLAFDGAGELVDQRLSGAQEGIYEVPKVFWLKDEDTIAPEPDQSKFGTTTDPAAMKDFLTAAQTLLQGQEAFFSTDVSLMPGTAARYYLDETIMAITWKQVVSNCAVTLTEIKIAHPSQFRRYFTGDAYSSGILQYPSTMSAYVNAVVGCAGDFYYNRPMGLVVYDGQVWKNNDDLLDTCHVDDKGNLLFTYTGRFDTVEEAQQFVDENNIRFSISFGPVLVDEGKAVPNLSSYLIGQVNDRYSRAVLCQLGELHYLVATFNMEGPYRSVMNIHTLQDLMMQWGVWKAYTLDGGQTGAIIMNDQLINRPDWGEQRHISDIFYFATAIPDHQENKGE